MPTSDTLSRRDFVAGSLTLGALAALPVAGAQDQKQATSAPAESYPVGCYTRPWAELDYRAAFDAIAEAGFKYCGLMTSKSGLILTANTPADQAHTIGEQAVQRKLKVASAYGGDIPVDSVENGVRGMKKLIDNCVAAGCPNLLMGGVGDSKVYDTYYKAIASSCDYAADKKIGISIKPHGGLNATGPQVRKTIEMVNHPSFRICYDAGNIYYYSDGKLDPVDDAPSVHGLVSGWCIKDFLPPKNVDVTPGTGKVNFAKVFAVLKKGGFARGALVIETLAPGDLPARLAAARKARVFVEQLVGNKE